MNSVPSQPASRRLPWSILILALLFFLPPLLALGFYLRAPHWQMTQLNQGQLLPKAIQIQQLSINDNSGKVIPPSLWKGRWHLWVLAPKRCDEVCQKALYTIRQVRLALGKERMRINRVLTTTSGPAIFSKSLRDVYEGTQLSVADQTQLADFFKPVNALGDFSTKGGIFIVDPLGNLVLVYPQDSSPSPIFKDLHRLLDISQIG